MTEANTRDIIALRKDPDQHLALLLDRVDCRARLHLVGRQATALCMTLAARGFWTVSATRTPCASCMVRDADVVVLLDEAGACGFRLARSLLGRSRGWLLVAPDRIVGWSELQAGEWQSSGQTARDLPEGPLPGGTTTSAIDNLQPRKAA